MSVVIKKQPIADLRAKSPLFFNASLSASLMIMVFFFFFSRGSLDDRIVKNDFNENIEVIEIPPTKQISRPPPPARPKIPVEAEDEEEIDDVTIDDTDVNITEEVPDIADVEEEEPVAYYAVQKKPKVLKQKTPVFPEIAKKAGIEGMVVIQVTIAKDGTVKNPKVLKGHPMLNDAALEAVKEYRFSPGMQQGRPVEVKWVFPIRFRLN